MSELTNWVISELSSLLQYEVSQDMAKCILMIESNRDLEEYLSTLLDITNPSHLKFMKELMQRKKIGNAQGYKKTQLDNYIQSTEKKKKGSKGKTEAKKESTAETPSQDKSKTKFVSIYSPEYNDKTVLLKGRHICNCEAKKHSLINNCIKCGRIVCEQEGAGPCFFCSNQVLSRNGESSANNDSANLLKEKLLEFDRSSEQRTRVIDDESDYFSSNSVWLSKEQQEQLRKKEEELQSLKHSRGKSKLLLDFTGRVVVQDDVFKLTSIEDSLADDVSKILNVTSMFDDQSDLDPNSTEHLQPVYCSDKGGVGGIGSKWHNQMGRVQDKRVMEMTDSGLCLSMHQPWASLLVAGIKKHEGRKWYSSHRGRLWIASTSKVPTREEIDEAVSFYKMLLGDDIKIGKKFPSGSLLGCVTVTDCLTQEDYREEYPNGEIDEPFVFICENPTPCPVIFPIKGQNKIYKLDTKIHQAAAKCIQKVAAG